MLALNRYFSWQQKFQDNYKHGVVHEQSWLHDGIVGDRASPQASKRKRWMRSVLRSNGSLWIHLIAMSDFTGVVIRCVGIDISDLRLRCAAL